MLTVLAIKPGHNHITKKVIRLKPSITANKKETLFPIMHFVRDNDKLRVCHRRAKEKIVPLLWVHFISHLYEMVMD